MGCGVSGEEESWGKNKLLMKNGWVVNSAILISPFGTVPAALSELASNAAL